MNVALTQPELERSMVKHSGHTAGYIRLTREESLKKGLSAPAQKADIADYVKRNRLPELEYYDELKAVGGDVPFEKRLQGHRLINDIKADRIAHLIVRDMDRLTRDVYLWLRLNDLCFEHGVTIHTLSGVLANKSPTDKFSNTVRAAAAQLEKEQVGDRVRRVKRQLASQGRHTGGPPPYGYTSQSNRRNELIATGLPEDQAKTQSEKEFPQIGHLYVNETEAEVVRLVFQWYVVERWGCRRICNELNKLGLRRRSGRLWHPDKVRRIINDPVVAGFIPYDEVYFEAGRGKRTPKQLQKLNPGCHKAIVSKKIWDRAQEIKRTNTCHHLSKGSNSYAVRKYALSGILKCACGGPMAVGSAKGDKDYGYYQCRKRKYYGPDAIGGCNFPRINTKKVHEAFWQKLSELICGPKLVNRVYKAARQILEERQRIISSRPPIEIQIKKIDGDLKLWYERHDFAKSDVEKEAAWRRIVELTEQFKQLKQTTEEQQGNPKTEPVIIDHKTVAKYLTSMKDFMSKTDDRGKAFVQSMLEHHGLNVQMQDAQTIVISLKIRPPGNDNISGSRYVVPLKGEARLPMDQITAWVEEHQGKHKCECGCGRVIPILRQRYWKGLPKFHPDCRYKAMQRKRAKLAKGYYTGSQAASKLGISRTTLGRWLKKGKLPKPKKSISGMLLFDRGIINRLAK